MGNTSGTVLKKNALLFHFEVITQFYYNPSDYLHIFIASTTHVMYTMQQKYEHKLNPNTKQFTEEK